MDGGFQGHDLMFHRAVWKPTIQHMFFIVGGGTTWMEDFKVII